VFKKSILETGFLKKKRSFSSPNDFDFKKQFSSDEITRVLSYIDPDTSYDIAKDIGAALKYEGFSRSVWQSWCKQNQKYPISDFRDEWESFGYPQGLKLENVLKKASQKGYIVPSEIEKKLDEFEYKQALHQGFPLIHWSELKVMKPRNYLVKGLIDQGGMSVLYGASNSGKTFTAIDLACHVALGWEWCGKKVKQGAVLYIAAEGGLGILERLTAFKKHHGLKDEADVYVLPRSINLGSEKERITTLIDYLEKIPNLRLIVIDTLARTIGEGEENSSSDMGAYIKNCDVIREFTGAHVMVIHHTGKDENRGARGHSSLKAAIDTEIEVYQKNQIVTAAVTKQREGRTGDKLHFEFCEYEVRRDEDNDAVYSCALQSVELGKEIVPLSGQAFAALNLLSDLIIDEAVDRVPKKGMKAQKCVRIERFREDFIKAGIANTDKPDSVNRAFLRAKNNLKDKGYIGEWDGYIWLSGISDKL